MEYVVYSLMKGCDGEMSANKLLAEVGSREALEVWAEDFRKQNPNVQFISLMK